MFLNSLAAVSLASGNSSLTAQHALRWHERIFLAIGIFEIPLQIDTYLMFREQDAMLGAVGGINISMTTICFAYLYLIWFTSAAVSRRRRLTKPLFGLPMIVYITLVALSALAATVPILALFDLILLLQAYAIFFYVANRIACYRDLLFVIWVAMGTMVTQSLIVFGLFALGPSAHGQEFGLGPLNFSVWDDGRPAGTMHSAVLCGSVLAIFLLPSAVLTLVVRRRLHWWLAASGSAIGMLAILITQTRGAILTAALGSLVIGGGMLVRGWLPRWTLAATFAAVLISVVPFAKVLEQRVYGDDGDSAVSRKHLSRIAFQTISSNPILGYGAGNCHLACEEVANSSEFRSEWYYTIHCKYLVVWIETGLFGVLAFLAVLGTGFRYGLATWLRRDRWLAPIGLAIAGAIAGHMVHMLVDIFNSRTQVQILWLIIGIGGAAYRLSKLPKTRKHDVAGVPTHAA